MRDYKKELQEDLEYGRENGFKLVLVEANPEKGFNYSYLAYIPENPQDTLIMDCLNDYEVEMPEGQTENVAGMEQIYSLFKSSEIVRSNATRSEGIEESKEQTEDRMYYRVERGIISLANLIGINPNAPAIIPLIPGYVDDINGSVISQLDKDVISQIAPQVQAMITDAKSLIENRTGVKMNDKIVPLGHSKSATFANNFSAFYPEMCEGVILGGGSFGTLPIDEIALQVVDDSEITDSEKFTIFNGKVSKKITQTEFKRIVKEYNNSRRDFQQGITMNADGTYNLPTNFPIGIADIEHYRDLPNGKAAFRKALLSMNKMIFLGEHEDTRPGQYAYKDGKTSDGIDVRSGDNVEILEEKVGHPITGIEMASMHNRVLEYISASNALFGRSSNERLESFMQLYEVLNMPVQSKIYEGVGHANFEYGSIIDGLDGISSKSIYASEVLKRDIASYYNSVSEGISPELDDTERAEGISPIPQLVRRYIASGRDTRILKGVSQDKMLNALKTYLGNTQGKNINRVYDEISAEQLDSVFEMARQSDKILQENKNNRDYYEDDER